MDDYLAAEPLIVARLEDQIPDVTIRSTWGMPKFQEAPDTPPAILLVLENDTPGEMTIDGGAQLVHQTWTCVVLVSDAANEAGPLLSQVIQAMNGWVPPGEQFSPFRRVKSGMTHDYSPSTVLYFPLAFQTSFVFNNFL